VLPPWDTEMAKSTVMEVVVVAELRVGADEGVPGTV